MIMRKALRITTRAIGGILIILFAIVIIFPLVVTVCGSFFSPVDISYYYNSSPRVSFKLVPDRFTLSQYYDAFIGNTGYTRAMMNSFLYTVPTVLIGLIIAIPAAYAFSCFDFPAKKLLFTLYLLLMLIPYQAIEIPHYFVLRDMGLIDTSAAVILPNLFGTLGVCLLTRYFSSVSSEIKEAAQLDGAGYFRALWYIILPGAKGGVAIVAALLFIDAWNMTEPALLFLSDTAKYPLSVTLHQLNRQFAFDAFAFSIVFMIPIVALYVCLHSSLADELESSTIKI